MASLPSLHRLGARAAPTPTPTPTAVPPVRNLPPDLAEKILDQVFQDTPPGDVCRTLYERCLLLRGSGNCPPNDPIWKAACLRFGLTPQAGFGGLGSWQETFRAFCQELDRLSPDLRISLVMYTRGELAPEVAMQAAIDEANVAMVQILLARGVSTETTIAPPFNHHAGETLLSYAIGRYLHRPSYTPPVDLREFEVVRALIDAGANLSARTQDGRSISDLTQVTQADGQRRFMITTLMHGGDPVLWIKAIFHPSAVLNLASTAGDPALGDYCRQRIAVNAARARAELLASNILLRESDDEDEDMEAYNEEVYDDDEDGGSPEGGMYSE